LDYPHCRRNRRIVRLGKKVEEQLYDIYYEALSKDVPEFGEIPHKLHAIINQTLQDDLLIQRGRAKDLKPLSDIQTLSEIAYQKAQNKVKAEDIKRRESKYNQGDD
jgi:hypothetical protein